MPPDGTHRQKKTAEEDADGKHRPHLEVVEHFDEPPDGVEEDSTSSDHDPEENDSLASEVDDHPDLDDDMYRELDELRAELPAELALYNRTISRSSLEWARIQSLIAGSPATACGAKPRAVFPVSFVRRTVFLPPLRMLSDGTKANPMPRFWRQH